MQGSLAKLDPNGSWAKMCEGCCQLVLTETPEEILEPFSGTWPTFGIMLNGNVMERKPLARHTKEKECLSWPTPLAGEWKDSGNIERLAEYADTKQLNLTRLVAKLTVQNWPTPSTQEIEHDDCELTETGRRKSKNGDNSHSVNLADTVKMWRTPDANLGARGPKSAKMYEECKKTNKHALNLLDQVKHECNWPTPRAREGNAGQVGSKGAKHNAAKGFLDGVVLEREEKKWPTPTGGINNANTNNTSCSETVRNLRKNDGEKKLQRKVGGRGNFQQEKILQSSMCQRDTQEGKTNEVCDWEKIDFATEEAMRNLWSRIQFTDASFGRKHIQQFFGELNDRLHQLPYEMALATWQDHEKKISGLCCVRCGKPCENHVSEALAKIQEIWRPNANEKECEGKICNSTGGSLSACWTELLMGLPINWTNAEINNEELKQWPGWPAAMNNSQYSYEPPRVVEGQKNRAKRLKALGNGCIPQQVFVIFQNIVNMENRIEGVTR